MLCEAGHYRDTGKGLGSVTLSDGGISNVVQAEVSLKKASFLDSLLRRTPSEKNEKAKSSFSWSLFGKKTPPTSPQQPSHAESMAEFIQVMQLEGRSDEEINLHLSHILEERSPPSQPPPSTKGSTNIISQFLRSVQLAFKEEFGVPDDVYYVDSEGATQGLTVHISSAPFFGALPADFDLSYEELAQVLPVYRAVHGCINHLPVCKHDGSPLPGEQSSCSICLDEFAEGESLKSLPCVHFFHKDCIDAWLMVGHTCPVCKLLVE